MAWQRGTSSALASLALAAAAISSCTTTASPSGGSDGTPTSPPAAAASPGTRGTTPPSSSPPRPAATSPTFFTPTDTGSFAMTGRIEVAPALQDPFSNLLQRAALHERTITLDVVGTPDYPVQPGVATTLLFGTCKCTLRGQGMHLTVEDGSTIVAADAGAVGLRGTFRPLQTGIDAFLLRRP